MTGDPVRLDRFLVLHGPLAGRGRRAVAALVARGAVRVNGTRARKGTMLRPGDVVTLDLRDDGVRHVADATALTFVHVDLDLVAVDKSPGLPTTLGASAGPSLAAALLARFPEMAAIDPRHAGLVHRLDTGTSGLLLAARSLDVHRRLRAAFTAKRVVKEYLAVVLGRVVAPAVVTHPLARHPRSRRRMVVARRVASRAWAAETEITPIGGDERYTLVRLRMRSGVTHQLRVHLAAHGHPIVGDVRYGGADAALDVGSPGWHYLHARALAFDDALAPPLAAPFPEHWRPLFTARGWALPDL